MHSTVQTGLFTSNLLNYDHHHHPNHSSSSSHYYQYPSNSHNYHQALSSSTHHLHHLPTALTASHHHPKNYNAHGTSSVNASLLGINTADGTNQLSENLNLSASNINKLRTYRSNSNVNIEKIIQAKKHSICSTSSGPPQVVSSNGDSKSLNDNSNAIPLLLQAASGNYAYRQRFDFKREFKEFWACSKPCGILTAIFGILLLTFSIVGFLFLLEQSLCQFAQTCSNALLKVLTVSALVIGIVLTFFGFIVVIYVKKDETAKIIITSSKNINAENQKIQQERTESKQQQQQQQQQTKKQPSSSNLKHTEDSTSRTLLNKIDNKSKLLENNRNFSAPIFKSSEYLEKNDLVINVVENSRNSNNLNKIKSNELTDTNNNNNNNNPTNLQSNEINSTLKNSNLNLSNNNCKEINEEKNSNKFDFK